MCTLVVRFRNDLDHRRVVVASLVRGVGAMERDRQEGREGPNALAPAWWESFNFELQEKWTDCHDSTIYGAVYRFGLPDSSGSHRTRPNYVVAFRGTNTGRESIMTDMKHNAMCLVHSIHQSPRFKDTSRRVQALVEAAGATNVWLAGHSLGSAMAMVVGKVMVTSGASLETYLFSPPFISLPVERIKFPKLRHVVHTTASAFKSGLAVILKAAVDRPLEDRHFAALSKWVPYIFVNENDPICSGYVGYFGNRRNMEAIGAGEMGRIATQSTVGSLVAGAVRMRLRPHDILPSAHLTVNLNGYSNIKEAHAIKQWWDSSAQFERSIHLL